MPRLRPIAYVAAVLSWAVVIGAGYGLGTLAGFILAHF